MPLCPYAAHPAHLELTVTGLKTALARATWPPTNNLIPAGSLDRPETWRQFYGERIQLGVISLYPRTLTGHPARGNLPLSPPRPLLEILLVPHWSHLTDLRQGVHTRRQRLQSAVYSCCELAFAHTVIAQLWPVDPPFLYAITHEGAAAALRFAGYRSLDLPPSLVHIYRPAIDRSVRRDDPNRGPVGRLQFVYLPGEVVALPSVRDRFMACAQRGLILLNRLSKHQW